MKKFLGLVLAGWVGVAGLSSAGFAAENEILVSSYSVLGTGTSSVLRFTDATTDISLNVGYGRMINEMVEGMIKGQINWVDTDLSESNTAVFLGVGPRVNFQFGDSGLENAAFIGATVGLVDFGKQSSTEFAWEIEAGKRIALASTTFSYTPTVNYGKVSGSRGAFAVVPLAFSYLF